MHPADSAFGLTRYQHCLIGFLLDDRSFSLDYMQQYIRTHWGLPARVIHRDRNCFYIKLDSAEHCAIVLYNGPYAIDGALFVVGRWQTNFTPDYVRLQRILIWIRLYGLPVEFLSQQTARRIASAIGEVQEVRTGYIDTRHTTFLRSRVWIRPADPLSTGTHAGLTDGRTVWLKCKYERIFTYCQRCGTIGHETPQCPISNNFRLELQLEESFQEMSNARNLPLIYDQSRPLFPDDLAAFKDQPERMNTTIPSRYVRENSQSFRDPQPGFYPNGYSYTQTGVTTISTRHPAVIFQEEVARQASLVPAIDNQTQLDFEADDNWSLPEGFIIPEDPNEMPTNRAQADAMTQTPHPRTDHDAGEGPSNLGPQNIHVRHVIEEGEIVEHQYVRIGEYNVPLLQYGEQRTANTPQPPPQQPPPEGGFPFAAEFTVTVDSEIPRDQQVAIDPMPRASYITWQPACPDELTHNYRNAIQTPMLTLARIQLLTTDLSGPPICPTYKFQTNLSPIDEENEIIEPTTDLSCTLADRRHQIRDGKRKLGESSGTHASSPDDVDELSSSARQYSPPPPVPEVMEPPPQSQPPPIADTNTAMDWALQEAGITSEVGKATAKRKIEQFLEITMLQRRRLATTDLEHASAMVTNISVVQEPEEPDSPTREATFLAMQYNDIVNLLAEGIHQLPDLNPRIGKRNTGESISNDASQQIIQRIWHLNSSTSDSTASTTLSQNLNTSLIHLHNWSRQSYGYLPHKIKQTMQTLASLSSNQQALTHQRHLDAKERELEDLLDMEHLYWQQRSKCLWNVHGERNTTFFHKWATIRKGSNYIQGIQNAHGNWTFDQHEIQQAILNHY
ncbi:OLC1v1006319C1 [Oldenlandia corymbosa var. corymbosa]|uniref:OLC1v1006319C1 n=1 Tax=Oldenlandia corymbosa var. corymbosa TaxID=529605 RepID=A0AAV1DGP7_OLDCO|nr:OLC1v1006319C1 [Oldenlandia corymbosa var. corymbosa]